MMPVEILAEFEKRDIYKSRIYQLCEFLIRKRQSPECRNITGLLRIPLREMATLLDYTDREEAEYSEELKIEKLKEILQQLNEDSVDENSSVTAITIKNPEVLDDFLGGFNANKKIIIKCSTEGLEAYKAKLKELTLRTDFDAGEFSLKRISDDKYEIHRLNKKMSVTRGNRTTANGETGIPIKLYIVLLLFGKKVPIFVNGHNEEISIKTFDQILGTGATGVFRANDYQQGHDIPIRGLINLLACIQSPAFFDATGITIQNRKAVVEAILALEKDSREQLGKALLIRSDDKTSVRLNVSL